MCRDCEHMPEWEYELLYGGNPNAESYDDYLNHPSNLNYIASQGDHDMYDEYGNTPDTEDPTFALYRAILGNLPDADNFARTVHVSSVTNVETLAAYLIGYRNDTERILRDTEAAYQRAIQDRQEAWREADGARTELLTARREIEALKVRAVTYPNLTDDEIVARCITANTVDGQVRKIAAIKDVRTALGWGLKESKDAVDKIVPPAYHDRY